MPWYGCSTSSENDEFDPDVGEVDADMVSVRTVTDSGEDVRLDLRFDGSNVVLGSASITQVDGTVDHATINAPMLDLEDVSVRVDPDGTQHITLPDYGTMIVRDLAYSKDGSSLSATVEAPNGKRITLQLDNLPEVMHVASAVALPVVCAGPQAVLCGIVAGAAMLVCGAIIVTSIVLCYNSGGDWQWSWWPPCSGGCVHPSPSPSNSPSP
jgi:hypothetical protein